MCNYSGFPVAQHFKAPPRSSLHYLSVTGIIHWNSFVDRLNIENHIIFKLGTLSPLELNTKFDAFFSYVNLTRVIVFQSFNCFYLKKGQYPKCRELNQFSLRAVSHIVLLRCGLIYG